MKEVEGQNILDILVSSLLDHPEECGSENEMRYKLVIDSSEDGSLIRLLSTTGVLEREKTRVYMCSDFPGDAQLQKVWNISPVGTGFKIEITVKPFMASYMSSTCHLHVIYMSFACHLHVICS